MELFTLGADRGAYTENDVRELARALTGLDYDWSDELGDAQLPLRRRPPRRGQQDGLRPDRPLDLGEARARMCVEHPLHPSFFVSKLWSYFIPTPPSDADTRRRSSALYVVERLPDPAGGRGDPAPSRALHGPADGQAAGRVRGRACCARSQRRDRRRAWVWLCRRRRPAALLPARRLGLGRQALARHEHGARALGRRVARRCRTATSTATRSTTTTRPRRPRQAVRRRAPSGATRT